jgi:hypothetical protein
LLKSPDYDDAALSVLLERAKQRSQVLRQRRRRMTSAAGLLAVAAGAAAAVTALLPANLPANHGPGSRLTAWTVVKQPGGDVSVTIHQLFYPAGLQHKLRADGVPASVTFYARRPPPSCRPYPVGRALLHKVFPPHPGAPTAAVVIRPSALPAGVGVYFNDSSNPYGIIGIHLALVHASKQCTGS